MTIAILFGTFVIALIIGIPVSVSLGISAVVSFIYCDIPLVMISQKLFTGIDSASLMAIPLFILAGNIMTDGGISGKIVEFVNCLTGRIRGSLGYTAVLACAIFAALSGPRHGDRDWLYALPGYETDGLSGEDFCRTAGSGRRPWPGHSAQHHYDRIWHADRGLHH